MCTASLYIVTLTQIISSFTVFIRSSSVGVLSWSGSRWIWVAVDLGPTMCEVGIFPAWDASQLLLLTCIHTHTPRGNLESPNPPPGLHLGGSWEETREPRGHAEHMHKSRQTESNLSSGLNPRPWSCDWRMGAVGGGVLRAAPQCCPEIIRIRSRQKERHDRKGTTVDVPQH